MSLANASKPSPNAQFTNKMDFANIAPTASSSPFLEIALLQTESSTAKTAFGKMQ
jgi:hypothetical protein